MFEHLNSQPSDKIMELMAQYAEDTRTSKLDLGLQECRRNNANNESSKKK